MARAKKTSWYNALYPSYKSRTEDFKKIFSTLPSNERLIVGKFEDTYQELSSVKWFFVGSAVTSDQAELQIFGLGNVFKTARAWIISSK